VCRWTPARSAIALIVVRTGPTVPCSSTAASVIRRRVSAISAARCFNRFAGSEDSAVVYFEIAPGDRLPLHTDSAEEILYIVSGEVEAQVGDGRGRLTAGDLAVIPAMVPHGAVNTGDEIVRVVGFFSESEITSTFDEPIQPLGTAEVVQGAPVPAAA
jgi:quercetin dioxygenase-like cupin family protein